MTFNFPLKALRIRGKFRHYLLLTGILMLGTFVRFWNLDIKPLWIDEIVTALLSLGQGYEAIPLETVFPLSQVPPLFSLNFSATWGDIVHLVITQSNHPPVFFCLLHSWLKLLASFPESLPWQLRSFSAVWGIGAIAAIYLLNRLAFSPMAGLMGAILMAVSPFGVYLSQEARHYTLPIFLITLSLGFLIRIYRNWQCHLSPSWWLWLGWIGFNTLGCYVHYFCLLSLNAQVVTLVFLRYRAMNQKLNSRDWIFLLLPYLFLLPWVNIFLEHFTSPKSSWLSSPDSILPLFHLLVTGLLMVMSFPVEGQSLTLQILTGTLTAVLGGWIGWQGWRGLKKLWKTPQTHAMTFVLVCVLTFIILQFLGIIYGFNKDLTVAPRYSFVYYPVICALFSASLLAISPSRFSARWLVPLLGLISCGFVVFNLTFQKPYTPQQVAQQFNQFSGSILIAIAYKESLHIPLGLSYALALNNLRPYSDNVSLVFFDHSEQAKQGLPGDQSLWNKLENLTLSPQQLWIIAPHLIQRAFTDRLTLNQNTQCILDPKEHYRIGIPYQLYRCSPI